MTLDCCNFESLREEQFKSGGNLTAASHRHPAAPEAAHSRIIWLFYFYPPPSKLLSGSHMKTSHFSYVTSFAGGVLTVSIHMHGCFTPLKSVGEAAFLLPSAAEYIKVKSIIVSIMITLCSLSLQVSESCLLNSVHYMVFPSHSFRCGCLRIVTHPQVGVNVLF